MHEGSWFGRLATVLVALAGCGDNLAAGVDGGPPPAAITWTPCGAGLECGTLIAPLSYATPGLGTIELAVVRAPARVPAERIGALVMAPGGPGQSGVAYARGTLTRFTPAMGEIQRRFDIVGMDVRGTGATGPLIECVDDATRAAAGSRMRAAASDAEVDAIADALIAGCLDPLTPEQLAHVDTASTARDLDRLREALGDPTISLFGESYGSWITALYAHTFPQRLRAAVVGSALSPANGMIDRRDATLRGLDAAARGFATWCDTDAACAFRPGSGTTYDAMRELASSLATAPLVAGGRTLDVIRLGSAVSALLYEPSYPGLDAVLTAARDGDPGPAFAALDASVPVAGFKDNLPVILALDQPIDPATGLATWRTRVQALTTEAPLFALLGGGDRELMIRLALRWPHRPDVAVTTIAAPEAPPLLVVAGELDPVTPASGAAALVSGLGNGSHLLATNAVGHSGVPTRCALARAQAYLLAPGATVDVSPCVAVRAPDLAVLGTVDAAFVWDAESARRGETGLGDFVADALRASNPTIDVAVINGGGIRQGLPAASVLPADLSLRRPEAGYAAGPPYDLVGQDARAVLPFVNRVARVTVTGHDLWQLLEFGVSGWTAAGPGINPFLQIAGMRMAFDGAAPAGARITSLTRTDGTPILDDGTATYVLALPDYVYYGGTGYLGLIDHPATFDDAMLDEALRAAIVRTPAVTLATDGRITVVP